MFDSDVNSLGDDSISDLFVNNDADSSRVDVENSTLIEYVDRDCDDCTLNAIAEFMGYLEMCVGGQLYIGTDPVTKGEMYDFFTKKRSSVVTTSGYPDNVTILTSNCAIVDWEQFYHGPALVAECARLRSKRLYHRRFRAQLGAPSLK